MEASEENKNLLDCICAYGKNLPNDTEKCPKCGLNLKPLNRTYKLSDKFDALSNELREIKEQSQKAIKKTVLFKRAFYSLAAIIVLLLAITVSQKIKQNNSTAEEKDIDYYAKYYSDQLSQNSNFKQIFIESDSILHFNGEIDFLLNNEFWDILISSDLPLSKIDIKNIKVRKPEPQKNQLTYIIRPGESLSEIAYSMYGDYNKWEEIYKTNTEVLKNPNQITVGTKLKISMPN